MPQMMPINWMFMFMFFIMIFILFNVMNYYIFYYNFNSFKKINMNNKFLFKSYFWKW